MTYRSSKRYEKVEVSVKLHHETERAYLFSSTGRAKDAQWVPKSQCEWHPDTHILELPQWLAEEKGFFDPIRDPK